MHLYKNFDFPKGVQEIGEAAKYLREHGSAKVGVVGAWHCLVSCHMLHDSDTVSRHLFTVSCLPSPVHCLLPHAPCPCLLTLTCTCAYVSTAPDSLTCSALRCVLLANAPPLASPAGFCMGGGLALAAAQSAGVDCAVPFYGMPPVELCQPETLKVPIQGHFGELDHSPVANKEAALALDAKLKTCPAAAHVSDPIGARSLFWKPVWDG